MLLLACATEVEPWPWDTLPQVNATLAIHRMSPSHGQVNVATDATPQVVFSHDVLREDGWERITLRPVDGEPLEIQVGYAPAERRVTVFPVEPLDDDTTYELRCPRTLASKTAAPLGGRVSALFSTGERLFPAPDGDQDDDGWPDELDCDPFDPLIRPDATEVCDAVDNDCDDVVDEAGALGAPTWYADRDGDGYGDAETTVVACEAPIGNVADDTDCDDRDAEENPGATEICDDRWDNDCDGDKDCRDDDCAC